MMNCFTSHSQSTAGITNQPDTSFTTYSAYTSTKNKFPAIRIAEELHSSSIKEQRNITYCSYGRRILKVDVFSPAVTTKEKRPAIMIIFGGGWRSGNRTMHYPLAQRLAELGYVCFTPDYRLSTEALYPAAVYDLKSALKWIHENAKQFNVDPGKIAVAGFSAGGQLAALLGTTSNKKIFDNTSCNKKFSSTVNAIIDIDGILAFIHPESGEGDDSKKTSAATYWFGYTKEQGPGLWKQASALTYVDKRTPPTLFINSSVNRMHAGRNDFINVLDKYGIYSETKTFEGAPHPFPLFHPWFDSTVHYIDDFLKKVFGRVSAGLQKEVIVAKDGSGNYSSLQKAFDAIPMNNTTPVTVFVKNGIYKEKLHLDASKNFVKLVGEDRYKTIITYDDHTGKISPKGDTINTRTSATFVVNADNFSAENITIQNDAGFTAGQAVGLESDGDKAYFYNCRITGNQDILFTNNDNSRQYFKDCYIEGTTDFIFGSSTVWFEHCHIQSKKNSHITAASTPQDHPFGYVFNDCILTGDTSLHGVSLGRPWRQYASVAYIHCYIGPHILPEGWRNWNNTENYKTTRYSEYENYGPGAQPSQRVKWSKQLTAEEIKKYTIKNILGDWVPDK